MRRRALGVVVTATILAVLLLFGPGLLRRETINYEWGGAIGAGVLQEPIGLVVAAGRVYVSDAARGAVIVFDTTGKQVAEWSGDGLGVKRPMHVSMGADGLDASGRAVTLGDAVFVADFYNHRVQVFSPVGGERIGRPGRVLPGRLHYPTDVSSTPYPRWSSYSATFEAGTRSGSSLTRTAVISGTSSPCVLSRRRRQRPESRVIGSTTTAGAWPVA